MNLSKEKQVVVKGKTFGCGKALQCITILSQNKEELISDIKNLLPYQPDIIEWRIDWYDGIEKDGVVADAAKIVGELLNGIPVLFTLRDKSEGGHISPSNELRSKVIREACESGMIDLVDIELALGIDFIDSMRDIIATNHVKLVLSCHDFSGTPSEEGILDCFKKAQNYGADIAKFAVKPHGFSDVVTLTKAVKRANSGEVDIPVIAISMGEIGIITRILNGEIGSDLTFMSPGYSADAGQAPHQVLGIEDYRAIRECIFNH